MTDPTITSNGSSIRNPLMKTISKTKSYGYFAIDQIRDRTNSDFWYDLNILATRESDVLKLSELS